MKTDTEYLRQTMKIAGESRASGNHPFGALLVGPDGEVLITSGNTYKKDRGVGHAENNVARAAARAYEPDFLAKCTLVTSVEPCSMCSGATYWAGIGTLVFGMSESRLLDLTGDDPRNPTLNLSCRDIFEAGQREITVRGPFPELEAEILKDHEGFW